MLPILSDSEGYFSQGQPIHSFKPSHRFAQMSPVMYSLKKEALCFFFRLTYGSKLNSVAASSDSYLKNLHSALFFSNVAGNHQKSCHLKE